MGVEEAAASSVSSALRTVEVELAAIAALRDALAGPALRAAFDRAIDVIAAASGRLIVTGMGKSGIVARRIAATMSSTGTPAYYLHPAEASHGDLGMVTRDDVVLALSWSGDTAELSHIIDHSRRFGATLIVMTATADSMAGGAADIRLVLPRVVEACPLRLAPTSSSTVQAVLGDALAMALAERREFTHSDFRALHPGGRLGGRLSTVAQLMGTGSAIPSVGKSASLADAAVEMSAKRYGGTAVIDDAGMLVGAFTDGDLRRSFASHRLGDDVTAHMTGQPVSVAPDTLASEALRLMNENAITMLFVCESRRLVGAVHLHDLLRVGIA